MVLKPGTMKLNNNPIVVFDGFCNFCNYWVRFIIKRDKKKRFRFVANSSEYAINLADQLNFDLSKYNSLVLVHDEKTYFRSTAALRILRSLGMGWQMMYVFIVVPTPIRDFIYKVIANNRYKWFGKRDSCMIPEKDDMDRFLEYNQATNPSDEVYQ